MVRIERTFAASAEDVFDAWTSPEVMRRWLHPAPDWDTPEAEVEGPEAGLEIIEALSLDDYQYLHSTRADLLRRLGRTEEARVAYEPALELARNESERRFLERRHAEL